MLLSQFAQAMTKSLCSLILYVTSGKPPQQQSCSFIVHQPILMVYLKDNYYDRNFNGYDLLALFNRCGRVKGWMVQITRGAVQGNPKPPQCEEGKVTNNAPSRTVSVGWFRLTCPDCERRCKPHRGNPNHHVKEENR